VKNRWYTKVAFHRSTQALLVMAAAAQYQPVGVLDPVIVGLILLLTIIDDNETPHTKTSRITSWEECFDRWNDAETSLHFRFSRAELRDLSNAIGFPETVVIGQTQNWKGRKIYATELFLITLKRFTYPDRWGTISMMFGLARPICSEIFSWTVDYLHRRFSPMMQNPRVWAAEVPGWAEDVFQKCAGYDSVFGFVDGTVRPMTRPGRKNRGHRRVDVQRIFYSGHKRVHAIKFQTIVAPPCGLIIHLFGPVPGNSRAGAHHSSPSLTPAPFRL